MFVKVQFNFNFDCSFERDKFNIFRFMISKNQVKLIRSLHVKKFREHEGLFIAEGEKIVNQLLNSDFKIHSFYFTSEWKGKIEKQNISYEISDGGLKKISLLESPNKILAVAHIPACKIDIHKFTDGLTLMLEDIQDPGNLGTIIRTADWFGIKNIICSKESVDAFNPKVVQSSMGSLFRMNIVYEDLENVLEQVKKELHIPVYGAVTDGKNIFNKNLHSKCILLMGNESKGISESLLNVVDEKITIPKQGKSAAESLNVAIATSILCYEFCK
jgi:RNA methyltransferase, TrmH family